METYRVTLGNLQAIPRGMNSGLGFFLLLRGTLQLENAGQQLQLREGDIAVLNHTDIFAATAQGPNVVLWIQLPFEYLDTVSPGVSGRRFDCCSAGADQASESLYSSVKHNVAQMAYIYYKKEAGFELLFQSVLFQTLYELGRDFSERKQEGQSQPEADTGRMASILAYMHQNYKNRISLEDVAKREFMSVQYLSKLFRQKMGANFSAYLTGLRLNSAVQDLVHSDDSVTKVALNNGFASVKAMNLQFRREYGCTPQQYRKNNRLEEVGQPQAQLLPAGSGASLDALVRFIDSHERRTLDKSHISHTLELGKASPYDLPDFKRIVNIGHLSNALRSDTRSQLEYARQKLGIGYVYFHGFWENLRPIKGHEALFRTYDCHETFNLFCSTELVPIIRLDLVDLLASGSLQASLTALCTLVTSLRMSQPPEYFARWQFELVGEPAQLADCFARVAAALTSVHPALQVGVRVTPDSPAAEQAAWENMLQSLAATPPAFVTLALDPNDAHPPLGAAAYEAFHQSYHPAMVARLLAWLTAAGMAQAPLYLLDWNTLTGKSTVEAGEFHRTALVADVLAGLMGLVSGFGIHLSLFSQSSMGGIITHSLSLFVYRNIRRPMFFVYRALASLKPLVLFQRDNMLVTADTAGRYAVLLYNPCYINPFQSLDNIRREVNERVLGITLKGLAPGKYRIKQFLMDKDNGSLYHSWVKLDFAIPLDAEDIDEYLENVSNPSVLLYETDVEDSCTLQQQLSMNATALFIIKRIG